MKTVVRFGKSHIELAIRFTLEKFNPIPTRLLVLTSEIVSHPLKMLTSTCSSLSVKEKWTILAVVSTFSYGFKTCFCLSSATSCPMGHIEY
ncbi:MAG: hypothetical protein DWQ04_06965 [Chloroflexi bacterium]|nr:MAG: hypothetical protein DWQ04_06965 [Chloroflexota bacterium]